LVAIVTIPVVRAIGNATYESGSIVALSNIRVSFIANVSFLV